MIKFEPLFLLASKLGCNKTRQKAIFWAANFPGGGGGHVVLKRNF